MRPQSIREDFSFLPSSSSLSRFLPVRGVFNYIRLDSNNLLHILEVPPACIPESCLYMY